ncbi:hypothetical protein LXL04_001904 [Taraxacum kok-saghyz]
MFKKQSDEGIGQQACSRRNRQSNNQMKALDNKHTPTRPVDGETAVVVVVECRQWSAGGGGGLRWSETRSVKEVAPAEENRQWRLGGKSEIGCKEKWEKLGHPVKLKSSLDFS